MALAGPHTPAWPQDPVPLEAVVLGTPEQDRRGSVSEPAASHHHGCARAAWGAPDGQGRTSEIPSPALVCLTSTGHWSPCFTGLASDFDIQKPVLACASIFKTEKS